MQKQVFKSLCDPLQGDNVSLPTATTSLSSLSASACVRFRRDATSASTDAAVFGVGIAGMCQSHVPKFEVMLFFQGPGVFQHRMALKTPPPPPTYHVPDGLGHLFRP